MKLHGGFTEAIRKVGYGEISLLVLVYLVTSLVIRWKKFNSKERFPPGPFAWPFIGHLHHLHNSPHQNLRDLSKKYGPLLGLKLGPKKAVAVASPELAKEVLLTHDKVFANRPSHEFTSVMLYGPTNDLLFSPQGPQWRKQRKLCFMSLFTAKRLQDLENVRQEETASLLLRLHRAASAGTSAGPIDMGQTIADMSCHIVMRLLVSTPAVLIGDENIRKLITELEHEAGIPTLGDLFPYLSLLDIPRKRHMRQLHDRVEKATSALISERKRSTSVHDDFLQALLSKEIGHNPAIPPQEAFTLEEIKSILIDMLAAGIHTTSITLEWAMAELLRNPHCFRRLREEINTELGKKRQITDADIPKLSYLKWVVKEVFRLHPVVPLLLPRISDAECLLKGYTLPPKTYMFVNVWAIQRDERLWEQANEFRPERFEGKGNIDVKGQNFELLPFGAGRRVCLGLPMALSLVDVTLANLVNNFDWELPPGESISLAGKNGMSGAKATPLWVIPKLRVSEEK